MIKKPTLLVLLALLLGACASVEERRDAVATRFGPAAEVAANCELQRQLLLEFIYRLEASPAPHSVNDFLRNYNNLQIQLSDQLNLAHLLENVHPDAGLRDIAAQCRRSMDHLSNRIELSAALFQGLATVDLAAASADTRRYVELLLAGYRRVGVGLPLAQRAQVERLRNEIDELGQRFEANIREDTRYLELPGRELLSGLPQDYVDAHPADDDGVTRISTRYPDYLPFVTYAHDDDARRQLRVLSRSRGYPDNEAVLRQLLEKRYQMARLLGHENFAVYITADKMSGNPQRVEDFLRQLSQLTASDSARDYQLLLQRQQQIDATATQVGSWQISYLEELVRRERFGADSAKVRRYFGYAATRDGIFAQTERLFGLTIEPWESETWAPGVESYVLKEGHRTLGRFYLDMHPREGKYQHAQVQMLVQGVKSRRLPEAVLVANLPGLDDPQARLEHADVLTFAHEFGHVLHVLLGGQQDWVGLSPFNMEWDFIEVPSTLLEEWFWHAPTLRSFAHNAAGEPIPWELVENMRRARQFDRALGARTQLFYAGLSLALYNADPADLDFMSTMLQQQRHYSPFAYLPGTHFYAGFGHLNGYSAIYYTYLWSEVIALDMFAEFDREGYYDVRTADRLRFKVLEAGARVSAEQQVQNFLGRPSSVDAYTKALKR